MKTVKITLRNKKSGIVKTHYCHHWAADSRTYYLSGVKGHEDYAFGMAFNKAEWERVDD